MLVETHSLTKSYGRMTALDACSIHVERGEVFGLLGPNGAGKTTLLRLLLGFLRPTSGSAEIGGFDCYHDRVKVHRQVAYLPGDARLFRGMKGAEVLRFFAEIHPTGDLAKALGLAERLELDLSARVAFMSTGMRQKLALAAALSSETALLVLDEPTANLDPTVRSAVLELVMEARAAGRTVIFSSHVLSEVEEICDRVVILRRGKLVHTQIMTDLRRRHRIRARVRGPVSALPAPDNSDVLLVDQGDGRILIETAGELADLFGWLSQLPLEDVRIEPVGLRSIYDRFHGPLREDLVKVPAESGWTDAEAGMPESQGTGGRS
ncbi:ABC transporter ATP-binding protein [Lignipirellula cremea]|uniref:ABC transporter ATP-binding protein n=1 Tax=Lignipirellula cremea TaxID=2528010 RepID=UPI001E454C02|nr:ABC transporter ATP-binding protein [Lignipirellula cremea]